MNVLSSIEHVSWNVILPAPFKGALNDKAIDTLVQADSIIPNIKSKHQYKQRNLHSLGWTGESINMFHAKDGHWTKHGMDVIRAFLRCVDLPLPLKPEEPKITQKQLVQPAKGNVPAILCIHLHLPIVDTRRMETPRKERRVVIMEECHNDINIGSIVFTVNL
jgi:hypothetical protein